MSFPNMAALLKDYLQNKKRIQVISAGGDSQTGTVTEVNGEILTFQTHYGVYYISIPNISMIVEEK